MDGMMKRLTNRMIDGSAYVCSETGDEGVGHFTTQRRLPELISRLAAYEDTGLEPDEINTLCSMSERAKMADILRLEEYQALGFVNHLCELIQAEKNGRLFVLQCKLHESIFYIEDAELFDDVPYEVSIGQKPGEWEYSLLYDCQDGFCFYEDDIGKTVFLTCEEAEEALKRM